MAVHGRQSGGRRAFAGHGSPLRWPQTSPDGIAASRLGALDNRCPLVRGSYWHVGTSASPSAGPRKRTKNPGAYRGFLLFPLTRPSIPSPSPVLYPSSRHLHPPKPRATRGMMLPLRDNSRHGGSDSYGSRRALTPRALHLKGARECGAAHTRRSILTRRSQNSSSTDTSVEITFAVGLL